MKIPDTLDQWTLAAIRRLLAADCVEDGRFDWKAVFPPDDKGKDRIVRCAAAMANAGGGFLIFGVADRGDVSDRIAGVARDDEFGTKLADQFHRADPPIPHRLKNPPIRVAQGRAIYVVEIYEFSAPHSVDGRFLIRTGGGNDKILRTHELRSLFLRSSSVLEAPGLNDIRKASWAFLRRRGWDRVREGLETIGPYVLEGTPMQKRAIVEALSRLAMHVRAAMPDDVLQTLIDHLYEARPHRNDNPIDREALRTAIDVAGVMEQA